MGKSFEKEAELLNRSNSASLMVKKYKLQLFNSLLAHQS